MAAPSDADLIAFDYQAARADPLFVGALSGLRHAQGFLEVLATQNADSLQEATRLIGEAIGEEERT